MALRSRISTGIILLMGTFIVSARADAGGETPDAGEQARQFVAAHEAKVRPLEKAAALAWWNANISGKDEDFAGQGGGAEPARRRPRRPRTLRRAQSV